MRPHIVIGAIAGVALASSFAGAGTIPYGTYRLANHPDGNIAPPPYGLRLDGLYNATAQTDRFTFDFNHAMSDMVINIAQVGLNDVITISGDSWGGRDIGGSHANDVYLGVYQIYFQYTVGVGIATPDDDRRVTGPGVQNFGTITGPGLLGTKNLADIASGGTTFRLGDEGHDNGHRGFDGISGWGWLGIQQSNGQYVRSPEGGADDWLFTVIIPMPTPGLLAVAGLGGLALVRRRRMA